MSSHLVPLSESDQDLLAVPCACGHTLVSLTRRGLVAQVATHWRLRHSEPIVITPEEFVARHAFASVLAD